MPAASTAGIDAEPARRASRRRLRKPGPATSADDDAGRAGERLGERRGDVARRHARRAGEHHRGVGRHVAVRRVARRLDGDRAEVEPLRQPPLGRQPRDGRRAPAPSPPRTDPSPFPPMRLALAQDRGRPPRAIWPARGGSRPALRPRCAAALRRSPCSCSRRAGGGADRCRPASSRRWPRAGRCTSPSTARPSAPSSIFAGRRSLWRFADGTCDGGRWWDEGDAICFSYEARPDAAVLALPAAAGRGRGRARRGRRRHRLRASSSATDDAPLPCPGPDLGS